MGLVPEGPVKANAPHIVLPERESMKTSIEALIYHFKLVTEGFHPPVGEVYQTIESPRGEIGFYIVSDGTGSPYRVKARQLRQLATKLKNSDLPALTPSQAVSSAGSSAVR